MNLDTYAAGARLFRYHASLLHDSVRLQAYSQGLSDVIKRGDVVLDVGTGTGILAFLACRLGASRVYAVERGRAVELAKAVALADSYGERVVFLEGHSSAIDVPEQVDVIVTETLWNFGLGEGLLGTVLDARDRFLKDGGTIVPCAVEMQCAPVESAELYQRFVNVWDEPISGIDFHALRSFATNNIYVATFSEADLLTEPIALANVRLLEAREADVMAEVTCRVTRGGTAHGIAGWFRADVSEHVGLSNAPPVSTPSWDHAFLPLAKPLDLEAGSRVTVTVATSANGSHWSWDVKLVGQSDDSAARRSRRSTLFGLPSSSLEMLHRQAGSYCPQPSREFEAAALVISSIDGKTAIERIEQELHLQYPDIFRSREHAGAFVRDIVAASAPADS